MPMHDDPAAGPRLDESHLKGLTSKGRMCFYRDCPAPTHSKKWRIVSKKTSAGNRNWAWMIGQTLCDSCYSTFRKHGTFVRSVRTQSGWLRIPLLNPEAPGNGNGRLLSRPPSNLHHAQRYETEYAPSTDSRTPGARIGLGASLNAPRPSRSRKPSEKQKNIMQGSTKPDYCFPDLVLFESQPPQNLLQQEAENESLSSPSSIHLSMDLDDGLDRASCNNAQSTKFVTADVSEVLEMESHCDTMNVCPASDPFNDLQRLGISSEELETALDAQHRAFFLNVFADNAES